MEIYADFDKLVNYYGTTAHTGLVITSLNGADVGLLLLNQGPCAQ